MVKKKVLVHGAPESLQIFITSPFNREYEVVGIITNSADTIRKKLVQGGV